MSRLLCPWLVVAMYHVAMTPWPVAVPFLYREPATIDPKTEMFTGDPGAKVVAKSSLRRVVISPYCGGNTLISASTKMSMPRTSGWLIELASRVT